MSATIKNRILDFVLLLTGGATMVLELAVTRLLAPYYGASINTWTMAIGITLASLSAGYWYGGYRADRNANENALSTILLAAGLYLAAAAAGKDMIFYTGRQVENVSFLLGAFLSTSLLLCIPNFLLGMVSPYVVKLRLTSLKETGQKVGNLYALSTAGSIAGTFLAGFVLIPQFGTDTILMVTGLVLVGLSFITRRHAVIKIVAVAFCIGLLFFAGRYKTLLNLRGIHEIDSAYGKLYVLEVKDPRTKKAYTFLVTGAYGTQSIKFKDKTVTPYITLLASLLDADFKKAKNILVIGGGALTVADHLAEAYPSLSVDNVEIDPAIVTLASAYFGHRPGPHIRTVIDDGRVYLNGAKKKYDIIFNDAYVDAYPPFHLLTREALTKQYALLEGNGVSVTNIIASLGGDGRALLASVSLTYRAVFPYVYAVPLQNGGDKNLVQNFFVIGSKTRLANGSAEKYRTVSHGTEDGVMLTDTYAPVEYFMLPVTLRKPAWGASWYLTEARMRVLREMVP